MVKAVVCLTADTVEDTKLAFKLPKTTGLCSTVHGKFLIVLDFLVTTTSTYKLPKTTGHCSTVHGKFLIVLDFLVTATSTDTLESTGTLNLQPLSNKSWINWSLPCPPLTSHQQASVSQGRICTDNCTCCHTETEVADQTSYLTQSQYTDTGPSDPSADPITPGARQGSHCSALLKSQV